MTDPKLTTTDIESMLMVDEDAPVGPPNTRFISWPDISHLSAIAKYVRHNLDGRHMEAPPATVTYRGKIKLHGTNAAVQCLFSTGEVLAQSRGNIITPEHDNAGFAKWVDGNKGEFLDDMSDLCDPGEVSRDVSRDIIIYGEWCGKGIQSNVAIAGITRKIFAVFAVGIIGTDELIVDPWAITALVPQLPDLYVLPWLTELVDICWLNIPSTVIDGINADVQAVEDCDPWVKTMFNVEGTGEGIVYYPVSQPGRENFRNLSFKAKGSKHSVVKQKVPVQIDPAVASGATAFAEMVCTEARLEQGARSLCGPEGPITFNNKDTGKFIGWVCTDVNKETQNELAASGLTWKQVQNAVTTKARLWFLMRANNINP